jgi:glycosyltransferase involved in cell wall biosynthesis
MASAVSVILPTYNRASFLPDAFASIRAQSHEDWELVVVDDGSTDGTRALVEAWSRDCPQPITYVWQENQGAYAARNTGLDQARAPLVAFFDSDDLWKPHYLKACVNALQSSTEVDWVFTACEVVNAGGDLVDASTFYPGGKPRPFLALTTSQVGDLRVIVDDQAALCHMTSGIYCGLQNSVIRRRVFESDRFWPDYRVVEDAQFLLRALSRGIRLAYLPDVGVTYRVHEGNSSASAVGADTRRLRPICEEKIRGLERLSRTLKLTDSQLRVMERNLANEYFWHLGYACCWTAGDRAAARQAMRTGLRLSPLNIAMWKTYVFCTIRSLLPARSASH